MSDSTVDPMDLPSAIAWRGEMTPVPSYLDFINHQVGLDRAFAVMRLLVPQFDEVRGCVLIRGAGNYSPESFEQWWSKLDGNVPAIEDVINHLHLWDVFTGSDENPLTEQALNEFGQSLVLTWTAALARSYPDRKFLVEMVNDEGGPTVGFHSVM